MSNASRHVVTVLFFIFLSTGIGGLSACSNPKEPVINDWGNQDLGPAGNVFDLNSPWSGTVVFTSNQDGSSSLMMVKSNNDLHMKGNGKNACYWSRESCTWIVHNIKLMRVSGSTQDIGVLTIVLQPHGDPLVEILMDRKATPAKIKLLDSNGPSNPMGMRVIATVQLGDTA